MLAEAYNNYYEETVDFLKKVVLKRCTIEDNIVKDYQYQDLKGVHLIAKLLNDGAALGSIINIEKVSNRTFKATLDLVHLGYKFRFTCYKTAKKDLHFTTQDYVLDMSLQCVVVPKEISDRHINHSLTTSFSSSASYDNVYVSITESTIYINYIEGQRAKAGMNQQSTTLDTYLSEQLGGEETFNIKDYPRYIEAIQFI